MNVLALMMFGYSFSWMALFAIIPIALIVIFAVGFAYILLFWSIPYEDANSFIGPLIAHCIGLFLFWVVWGLMYILEHPEVFKKLQ